MSKTTDRSLNEKFFAIMQNIESLEKDKENSLQKYRYISDQQYTVAIRKELIKQRINFRVEITDTRTVLTGEKQEKVFVTIQGNAVFTDVDTGETLSFPYSGAGIDNGDKGLFKAITGMKKYIMNTTFMIHTGDDAEADDEKASTSVLGDRSKDLLVILKATKTIDEYRLIRDDITNHCAILGKNELALFKAQVKDHYTSLTAKNE